MDRADIVHDNFLRRVTARDLPPGAPPVGPLTGPEAVAIFRAGCLTRALDRQSRVMQRAGRGFTRSAPRGTRGWRPSQRR